MKLNEAYIPKNMGTFYIIIGVIIFLVLVSYLWSYTVDDAYITFLFASHLAQGQGLVWNLGGMPVEGYSNFLWVIISAFAIILKINPVVFTRIVNIFFLIGIIFIYWKLSKDIFGDNKSSAYLSFSIGVLILLSNPATVIHFLSGLETLTYSFFVLTITFLAFKIIRNKNYHIIWIFSIFGFLTGLLRPEGILITIGLFLLILIFFKKFNYKITKLFKSFSLFFFIPIILYMIFRIIYFNEIFPIPFLIKTMTYGGFSNILENFSLYFLIPILFIIFSAYYYSTRNKIELNNSIFSTEKKFILCLIVILVAIVFANLIYVNMSLMMNYSQRFFYPSFVLLYILSSISAVLITGYINREDLISSNAIGIFLVILLICTNLYFISDIDYTKKYSIAIDRSHVSIGKSLEQYSEYNYTIVSGDAGAIPYFSKWRHIDLEGLTDVYIAKNHGISYYYLSKNDPELIILISDDGYDIDLYTHNHKIIYNYVLHKNYTKLSSIKFGKRYYLVPFLKPGIKDYNKIVNTLGEVAKNSKKE